MKEAKAAIASLEQQRQQAAAEFEKQGLLFTARIAVPNAKLLVDNKMLPLSPGMMASVEVKTGPANRVRMATR